MSRNGWRLTIATSLAVVLLVTIVPKMRKQQAAERELAIAASTPPGGAVVEPLDTGEKRFTGQMAEQMGELHAIDLSTLDAPAPIGAKALALARSANGQLAARLDLYSAARCMLGDYDLMELELQRDTNKRFYLMIESLDPANRSFPTAVQEVTLDDFRASRRIELPLPDSVNGEFIGIFICSDSSTTPITPETISSAQRCSNKTIVDLNKLSTEIGVKPDPTKPPEPTPDKIFYFQFFVLQNNSLTFFDSRMKEEAYPLLEQYVGNRLENSAAGTRGSKRALEFHFSVRSAPTETERNLIRINIPRGDGGICARKGIKPPPEIQEVLDRVHGK